MSPILKRDVSEHIRQARKLASVVVGSSSSEWQDPHASSSTLATSSSPRKGLAEVDEPPDTRSTRKGRWKDETPSPEDTGNTYPPIALDSRDRGAAHENGHIAEDLDGAETQGMLPSPWASRIEEMGFRDTLETSPDWRTQGKWKDLRNLLFEVGLIVLDLDPRLVHRYRRADMACAISEHPLAPPLPHRSRLHWRAPRTLGPMASLSARRRAIHPRPHDR